MLAAAQPALSKPSESVSGRTIPFDYAFRYQLSGIPRKVLDATVTVSIEASFVALSVGYGAIPDIFKSPIVFAAPFDPTIVPLMRRVGAEAAPSSLSNALPAVVSLAQALGEGSQLAHGVIGPKTAEALRNGIKLNPILAERVLSGDPKASLKDDLAAELFQVVSAPPEAIQFLYAIFDEGSGRAFQDEPILNTAGLGISNGDRPFRYFAKPIVFAPRSTIRMQVTEASDFRGNLHVSLQGYKVLGGTGTPTESVRRQARQARRRFMRR